MKLIERESISDDWGSLYRRLLVVDVYEEHIHWRCSQGLNSSLLRRSQFAIQPVINAVDVSTHQTTGEVE